MGRVLGRSDGMEQFDLVPCNSWVEFDSDPFAATLKRISDSHAKPELIVAGDAAFPHRLQGVGVGAQHPQ